MEPKKNPAKDVHRYSKHFFLIGFCISITLLITAFEWETSVKGPEIRHRGFNEKQFFLSEELIALPEKMSPTPIKKIQLINPENITELVDEIPKPDSPEIYIEPFDSNALPTISFDIPTEPKTDTFIWVQKLPLPIGGYAAFYKQVGKSINYPQQAQRIGTAGKVFVEFVINQRGEPVNFKIIKGIGNGCDEEAIRVIRLTKWEAGKQRGQPVPVRMVLPIHFTINLQ